MKITLNGANRDLPEGPITIRGLLEHLDLGPAPVLVERNGAAILNREYESETVADGDVIEIVRMVAGG